MIRKYADDGMDLDITPTDVDQGTLGQKVKGVVSAPKDAVQNTVFTVSESAPGKIVSGGLGALSTIGSIAGPVMHGSKSHDTDRQVGKELGKTSNLSKEAKERLEETLDQMKELTKEADDDGMSPLGTAMTAGVIAAGTTGVHAGIKGLGNLVRNRKSEKVWEQLQENHPELANEDTREHFEVIQQFSPDLATNPSTARSFLKRMKRTGMAPHEFVDRLTQTQSKIEDDRMSSEIADQASSSIQSSTSVGDFNKASSGLQQKLDDLDPR